MAQQNATHDLRVCADETTLHHSCVYLSVFVVVSLVRWSFFTNKACTPRHWAVHAWGCAQDTTCCVSTLTHQMQLCGTWKSYCALFWQIS